MIATCFLAARLSNSRSWPTRIILALLVATCLADLVIIDARRFTGKAIVACLILLIPGAKSRCPLIIIAACVAAIYFWLTYTSIEPENILRFNLMAQGWQDARNSIWFGSGLHYTQAHGITFSSLWAAGITESGVISMIQQVGLPATIVFFSTAMMALASRRVEVDEIAIIFAMLLADFECNTPIDGFLGAALYFSALLIILLDEEPRRLRRLLIPRVSELIPDRAAST
jgi:hypothetical protein